ncbi:MAG: glycosyltransferase family 4 protein [Proteobacteria bacterium]|nr:glycosyltransferase family 4 protein [Pseudomonadota bacterium]MBU1545464.1 glycosyltransferase family 4 protein [Pseudomonadota bacterium]
MALDPLFSLGRTGRCSPKKPMKVLLANKSVFKTSTVEPLLGPHKVGQGLEKGDHPVEFMGHPPDGLDSAGGADPSRRGEDLVSLNTFMQHLDNTREAAREVRRLIAAENPEIAHLYNPEHSSLPAMISPLKRAGVKVVLSLHDYKLLCPSQYMLGNGGLCSLCAGKKFWRAASHRCANKSLAQSLMLSATAYYQMARKSYEKIDCFITPSRFMAEMLQKNRFSGSRFEVLPYCVDTRAHQPSLIDEGYILFAGRLSRETGIDTLLRAHNQLDGKVGLRVVGAGPLYDELSRKYPKAEFWGAVSEKLLGNLIDRAGFVVVPSEWYENCSPVMLRAMAAGKPLIGANIGGIPEFIDNEKTGFLFETGCSLLLRQKMEMLLADKKMRRAMGQAARCKAEEDFSLGSHKRRSLAIYQSLLDRG